MAIDGVVALVGFATDKPFGERRIRKIKRFAERLVPVDQLGLFGPELIAVFDRLLVKLFDCRHEASSCRT
jgi:hypothetical protein